MEYAAWFTHKHVMHGFLWVLHEDRHHPTGRGLQKNDLFAVFFNSFRRTNGVEGPPKPSSCVPTSSSSSCDGARLGVAGPRIA